MEQLIDDTKSVDRVEGVEEIFFPGELEDRSRDRVSRSGITLAENTVDNLLLLAKETGATPPTALSVPTPTGSPS